jgi:hypothetical protein
MNHFYFQSFGEYRTLLEQFNITAEEIKGKHNGILYSVTDDRGIKQGDRLNHPCSVKRLVMMLYKSIIAENFLCAVGTP